MSENPCVSVVVPFFNSERHLAACIESLLGQDDVGGPFEIILIDNGSTDGSASIVERYRELIVLDEPTPGAYAARNTGIRRARAPLIAFTDADCVVAGDWLRSLRDGMQDPTIAILLGHCRYPPNASLALRVLGAYENAKAEYVINHCEADPPLRLRQQHGGPNLAIRGARPFQRMEASGGQRAGSPAGVAPTGPPAGLSPLHESDPHGVPATLGHGPGGCRCTHGRTRRSRPFKSSVSPSALACSYTCSEVVERTTQHDQ